MINTNLDIWGNGESFSHIDFNLSESDIIDIIKSILTTKFSNRKTEVRKINNRINFACPYCGDSQKDDFKARGNLYNNNGSMQYHCYNCGKHTTLKKFIQNFLPNFDTSKISNNYNYNYDSKVDKTNINILDTDIIDKYSLDKSEVLKLFNWKRVEDSKGEYYLNFRLITNKNSFAYDPKYNSIIILNLNKNNKIIGLQIRPIIKSKKTPRFFTFNLTKIYEKIKPELLSKFSVSERKHIDAINSISSIFNIFQVDFNKELTIFEGPFDAMMFNNSVATSGATKKIPINIEKIRYWYDNDKTGWEKSFCHLKNNESVFLWSKYWNDLGFELKIKDLNELIIYSKKNDIKILNFENYFSNNELDAIFI